MEMKIEPVKIKTLNKRKFQEIALLVDREDVEKEIISLVKKWRGKIKTGEDKEYLKDLKKSLGKLRLPVSLIDLFSDCVRSGFLWKDYDLSGIELLETLLLRPRKSKTLTDIKRDRDWYWRHKRGESFREIAEKDGLGLDGVDCVKKAIRQYKRLISREK